MYAMTNVIGLFLVFSSFAVNGNEDADGFNTGYWNQGFGPGVAAGFVAGYCLKKNPCVDACITMTMGCLSLTGLGLACDDATVISENLRNQDELYDGAISGFCAGYTYGNLLRHGLGHCYTKCYKKQDTANQNTLEMAEEQHLTSNDGNGIIPRQLTTNGNYDTL